MAREDPQSLAAVSSFKVSRRGIGCVRWLEPTDVRGLDVNGTVRLTRGVVEVGHSLQPQPWLSAAKTLWHIRLAEASMIPR